MTLPGAANSGTEPQPEKAPASPAENYGFWRTAVIVFCGHLGVRPSHKREQDFARANGVMVFAVALLYFAIVIVGLIVLVNYIASRAQ